MGRTTDPDRWFGSGADGLAAMFAVWGETDPKTVARIPLHRAATRPLASFVDTAFVDRVLADPHRPRRRVDPRLLWASQYGVTHGGVHYYFTEPRYRRTGWTWADQWTRINREVVVWAPAPDGPQLLSGHHRTTAALLHGNPIEVVWLDPADPVDPDEGTRITPLLWWGTSPHPAEQTASAAAAYRAIVSDLRAIVNTEAEARQVLADLGVGSGWIDSLLRYATTGRVP